MLNRALLASSWRSSTVRFSNRTWEKRPVVHLKAPPNAMPGVMY